MGSTSVGPITGSSVAHRFRRRRFIPAVVGLAVLAAGCGSPSASTSTETQAPVQSSPLKPPGGEHIAFLLEETRGKLLCQVLDDTEWGRLLGGPIQRTTEDGKCNISSDTRAVILELTDEEDTYYPSREPVAGRPARMDDMENLGQILQVSLFDGLSARGYNAHDLTPYLDVIAAADKGVDPRGEQITQAVVQKLTRPGPALPQKGEFIATPPTPGTDLIGLAVPIIARQMCTAGLDAAEQTPTTAKLYFTGDTPSCTFVQRPNSGIIKYDDGFWNFHIGLTRYTADRPTGRPGELQATPKNPGGYVACLDESCQYWLNIEGEDTGSPVTLRQVAERVVSRFLGK